MNEGRNFLQSAWIFAVLTLVDGTSFASIAVAFNVTWETYSQPFLAQCVLQNVVKIYRKRMLRVLAHGQSCSDLLE